MRWKSDDELAGLHQTSAASAHSLHEVREGRSEMNSMERVMDLELKEWVPVPDTEFFVCGTCHEEQGASLLAYLDVPMCMDCAYAEADAEAAE